MTNSNTAPAQSRTRYRYRGRVGSRMYWEAPMPGDSRVDQVSCDWAWFWSNGTPGK